MRVGDLGVADYRSAWAIQEETHARVAEPGGAEELLLVEHPPVITLGRRAAPEQHVVAPAEELARRGVDVVQSDRGGDVTLHAPGQLVAYPIIRLVDHRLSVGGYVRRLEEAVVLTLADFAIAAGKDPTAIGVWTPTAAGLAKVCAIGVRVRKGATLHGLALNVTTDLSLFDLIVPCGLAGRPVTSMEKLLGAPHVPAMEVVKDRLAARLRERFDPDAPAMTIRMYEEHQGVVDAPTRPNESPRHFSLSRYPGRGQG